MLSSWLPSARSLEKNNICVDRIVMLTPISRQQPCVSTQPSLSAVIIYGQICKNILVSNRTPRPAMCRYVSRVQASAAQQYYFFHGQTEILWIVIVISAVSCFVIITYIYSLPNYYVSSLHAPKTVWNIECWSKWRTNALIQSLTVREGTKYWSV